MVSSAILLNELIANFFWMNHFQWFTLQVCRSHQLRFSQSVLRKLNISRISMFSTMCFTFIYFTNKESFKFAFLSIGSNNLNVLQITYSDLITKQRWNICVMKNRYCTLFSRHNKTFIYGHNLFTHQRNFYSRNSISAFFKYAWKVFALIIY